MKLLNGSDLAGFIKERHAQAVRALAAAKIFPKLAIVQAKDYPVINTYVKLKQGYGADIGDLFRRAAGYVHLILKGQKPADMPIQLPTKFELIVNQRTARELGLVIPSTILVLTDEVID